MNNEDKALRDVVRKTWPASRSSSFEETWQASRERHKAGRRKYGYFASAAAIVAAVFVALNMQASTEPPYIEVAELLESTYWTAPSDALLPDRQFDIYQDMPEIFESTEPAGGSLL